MSGARMAATSTEVLKLRTVRYPWLALLAAEGLVVAGIVGLAMSTDSASALSEEVPKALGHVGLSALASLVLGLTAVAGEWRHRTITDTYLSFPARTAPLRAKLVVLGGAGALIGLAASVTAVVTTAVVWQAKGADLVWSSDAWLTLVGGIASHVLFAMLGVALGAVVGNLMASVAIALGWIALVEGIAAQLVGDDVARFLPLAAAQALGRLTIAGDPLPQGVAAVVLTAYVVALGVAARFVTLSRDVT